MRVFDFVFFALAFFVASIVGPKVRNVPHHKVLKMPPDKLKGVEVAYKTVYETPGLYPNFQYYQVIHSLYVVQLGGVIIGRTNTTLRLYPLHHSFPGVGREIVQIRNGKFSKLDPPAVIAMGMFQELPSTTELVDPPEEDPLIIIQKDARFRVSKVIVS